MNFFIIANIFVGMSKHPTLIVMLTSKSLSSFFKKNLLFSLRKIVKEHMILNKLFNQKQVKMKSWEDPSNQKTNHAPPPPPHPTPTPKGKTRHIMNAY
jgi:hypothetical protein